MSIKWLAIALLPAVAGAWSWNQHEKSAPKESRGESRGAGSGLVRVHHDGDADGDDADDASFDRAAWKKKLTSGDLEQRERAFDELAETARENREAREALEEWSNSGDSELSWTSRLLLRDVRRGPQAFAFHGPHFDKHFGRRNGGSGWDGFGIDVDDFAQRFDDLDSMFGDLRAQWDEMLRSMPTPSSSGSSAHSMSLQTGPDGVTCTITEKVDGKEETKTYEAKSMDELLEAHPELRDQLGGGSGVHVYGLGPGTWSIPSLKSRSLRIPSRSNELRVEPFSTSPRSLTPGEPRTDVLGINCTQTDEGLQVESVHPNTIASWIGLREGDVVVEINGTKIRERGDVKNVLAERASDGDVSVVVVGKGGQRRTLTWKPKT